MGRRTKNRPEPRARKEGSHGPNPEPFSSKPQASSPRPSSSFTSPLKKATMLLRKAVSTSSEEEARTSAVIAARLIARHGLVLAEKTGSGLGARYGGWRQDVPAAPTVIYVKKEDPPPPGFWVEAVVSGSCFACHERYSSRTRVWAVGLEHLCAECRGLL